MRSPLGLVRAGVSQILNSRRSCQLSRHSSTQPKQKRKSATPPGYIEPRTSLFVSGASAQYVSFVVDPHLDFDAVFQRSAEYQAELTARGSPLRLAELRNAWTTLQTLWKQRDAIEAMRKEVSSSSGVSGKASEERVLEGRRLRQELKSLTSQISALEASSIVDLLKLPTSLHQKAPRSGNGEIVSEVETARTEKNSSAEWRRSVEYTDDTPRGYFLRGGLAELELRLIFHLQNNLKKLGFASISGPHLFKPAIMEGVGLDLSSNQPEAYMLDTEDSFGSPFRSMYLAHNPLVCFAGYFTNCEVSEGILPLRLQNSSRIYRPHWEVPDDDRRFRIYFPDQTHSVSFCLAYADPNQTDELFDGVVNQLKDCYSTLGVPFRIMNRTAVRLAPSEALRYDVEVWLAERGMFVPCGYVSINNDFVSKRLRCHVGKPEDLKFLSLIHGSFMELTPFLAGCLESGVDLKGL